MKNRAEASSRFSTPRSCAELLARQPEEVEQLQKRVRRVEAAAISAPAHQGSCCDKPVPALDSLLGGLGSASSASAR